MAGGLERDWKAEAFKLWEENRQRQEAQLLERLCNNEEFRLILSPSEDEPSVFTHEYQDEFRSIITAIKESNIKPRAAFLTVDSATAISGYTGEIFGYIKDISAYFSPIIIAWLTLKKGRKAKLEFYKDGSLKTIEAQTGAEVITLLKEAQVTNSSNKNKK